MGRVIEKGYINNVNWGPTLQNYSDTDPTYPSTPATWRKKYTYDKNDADSANLVGRLYSVVTNNNDDATAEVEEYFAYDKYGNVQNIRQKMLSYSANTCTTRYSYDLLGRLRKINYPASANGNVEINYFYDQTGRITTVAPTTGSAFSTYWYNLKTSGLDTETVNLSGTLKKIFYAHDTTGRLTSITSDLFREGITYRKGGYNNNEDFYHGLIGSDTSTYYSGGPSQQYYRFKYDNFGRLVIAENNLDAMDVGSGTGYATVYDSNSNIKNIKRGTGSFVTYNYYTGKNEIRNTGGSDYEYDVTGNLTKPTPRSIQYIKYDPFTQLTTIVKKESGDSTQLEYGGAKQRVLKSVTVSGTTTKTLYIHGVNDYPIVEKTSSGDERTYVYGPTGLIAVRVNTTWYYVLKDHLGSTRVVFNTSGAVQSAYDFDVYGTTKRATENITIPYKFTGQEFDVDMGLYNFRARLYDTTLAAFYAPDPAGSTFSPYGYANQNPMSFVDPTGMVDGSWDYRNNYQPNPQFLGINTPLDPIMNPSLSALNDLIFMTADRVDFFSYAQWTKLLNNKGIPIAFRNGTFYYNDRDQAASAGLLRILLLKGKEAIANQEFGGKLYKNNDDGMYSYSIEIAEGLSDEIPLEEWGKIPYNSDEVTWAALFHTHPVEGLVDQFSGGDLANAYWLTSEKTAYVWVPNQNSIYRWTYNDDCGKIYKPSSQFDPEIYYKLWIHFQKFVGKLNPNW